LQKSPRAVRWPRPPYGLRGLGAAVAAARTAAGGQPSGAPVASDSASSRDPSNAGRALNAHEGRSPSRTGSERDLLIDAGSSAAPFDPSESASTASRGRAGRTVQRCASTSDTVVIEAGSDPAVERTAACWPKGLFT
jgi:hypothetical protein